MYRSRGAAPTTKGTRCGHQSQGSGRPCTFTCMFQSHLQSRRQVGVSAAAARSALHRRSASAVEAATSAGCRRPWAPPVWQPSMLAFWVLANGALCFPQYLYPRPIQAPGCPWGRWQAAAAGAAQEDGRTGGWGGGEAAGQRAEVGAAARVFWGGWFYARRRQHAAWSTRGARRPERAGQCSAAPEGSDRAPHHGFCSATPATRVRFPVDSPAGQAVYSRHSRATDAPVLCTTCATMLAMRSVDRRIGKGGRARQAQHAAGAQLAAFAGRVAPRARAPPKAPIVSDFNLEVHLTVQTGSVQGEAGGRGGLPLCA